MDIKQELLAAQSKADIYRLVPHIGQDPEKFAALMELFFGKDKRLIQRSSAVLSICLDKHPFLIQPYLEELILNLNGQVTDTVKRNTLRILQHQDIPQDLQGPLADHCFGYLAGQEPPAIKAFALTVLANLARLEPDLNNELKLVIEDQMPYASPAFKSRADKILQALKKKPAKTR